MRIGLIAPPWIPVPPPAYGGTELVVGVLAEALRSDGQSVVLAAQTDSSVDGIDLVSCDPPPPGAIIGDASIEIAHAVRAYRGLLAAGVDVIHDHTTSGVVCAADLAIDARVPVVTTNHGPFDERACQLFAHAARRSAIVAISHAQRRRARGVPVAAVIHHGIDTAPIPFGGGADGYLAFVGRFAPEKGATTAIEIARRAGATLLIAAKMWEPAERRYFEEHVEPLLGDDVRYVGEIGGADKLRFLGGARALINPIDWDEPFGMTMIEAMACGTPVVATARGSVNEIVEHGTTGFIADTVDDLAEAVRAVDSLSRQECRRVAEECFGAHRFAAEHIRLYESLTASSTRRRPATVA